MTNDSILTFAGRRLPDALGRDATIYHSDQWLAALAAFYGYTAAPASLQDGGETVALAPLVEISNLSGRKLRTPPASMYSHVLFDSHASLLAIVETLLTKSSDSRQQLIIKVLGDEQVPLTEISREIDCRVPLRAEDENWDALHSAARRAVRKSERKNVVVTRESIESLPEFFRLLVATRKRLGLPVAPRAWMRRILRTDHAGLLIARRNQDAVAGVLFLEDQNFVHYAIPAYSNEGARSHAMDACLWSLIKYGCKSGRSWLGMGGSSEQNQGLRRFKTKWGGEERPVRLLSNRQHRVVGRSGRRGRSVLIPYAPAFALEALGYIYLRFLQ